MYGLRATICLQREYRILAIPVEGGLRIQIKAVLLDCFELDEDFPDNQLPGEVTKRIIRVRPKVHVSPDVNKLLLFINEPKLFSGINEQIKRISRTQEKIFSEAGI